MTFLLINKTTAHVLKMFIAGNATSRVIKLDIGSISVIYTTEGIKNTDFQMDSSGG